MGFHEKYKGKKTKQIIYIKYTNLVTVKYKEGSKNSLVVMLFAWSLSIVEAQADRIN